MRRRGGRVSRVGIGKVIKKVTVHGRGLILGASESLMSADPEQTGRTRTQCNGTRTRLVPFEYEYEYRQRLSTSTIASDTDCSWRMAVRNAVARMEKDGEKQKSGGDGEH